MFAPSIPSAFRTRPPLRVLDLRASESDVTPQVASWTVRSTPTHVFNHSLVINAPPLTIDRIGDKDVVMCSRQTLVSKVYEKLVMPRYSRVAGRHRGEHGFVYNQELGDDKVSVREFVKLFDRSVQGPSGDTHQVQPLLSLCRLVHAIQESKGGIADAFWSYIIMTAMQFWLIANDRFMFYNPEQAVSYSQAYPEYIFPISIFSDFAFEPNLVADLPPSKPVWELAREVTISEFVLWLYCAVSEFCYENKCRSLHVKREDAINDIDNKLHRNYELFLTSRRFGRMSYGNMGTYVADLNEAVCLKCAQYQKEVSSYTFGVDSKHWYPQQLQHRDSIKAPTMSTFAGAAVYFFCHPQFAPNKFILPEFKGSNELELRDMRWWMQWWCSKSSLNYITPSFNNYAALLRATESSTSSAAATATATATAVDASDHKQLELIPDFNSNSALPILDPTASTSAKSSTRKKPVGGRQNVTLSFWHHVSAWDMIDHTRLQYAVLYSGGRGPLTYVIDKGERDARHVHDIMRHDMSPLGLTPGAVLAMVHSTPLEGDDHVVQLRTAKEWLAAPPKGWRLQPDVRAPPVPVEDASGGAAVSQADVKKQALITDMLSALAPEPDPKVAAPANPPEPPTVISSAFPFDYLVLGGDHPQLSSWVVRDAWADEPATAYDTYLVMAGWYRVMRYPATRWFNLLQVLLLLSGDEATAYRYTLFVWCKVHGRSMPESTAEDTPSQRLSDLRTCRAFLIDLREAYVQEVHWVHSNYTKLVDRGREHKERSHSHNMSRFSTYPKAVSSFHKVSIASEHGFARFVPQHTLASASAKRLRKCDAALAQLAKYVSKNQWDDAFRVWELCDKYRVDADVAKGPNPSQSTRTPAADMVLLTLAHMWMHTWYCVLSVKSMCLSPCLISYTHLQSVGKECYAPTEYRKRNRRSGWSRYVSLARKAARESGRVDANDLDEHDALTARLSNLLGREGDAVAEYVGDWKAEQDAAVHNSNDLVRNLQTVVKRYLGSRAGKRALAQYVQRSPQLDAASALIVQAAAHCLDIGSVASRPSASAADIDGAPSAPLWRMHEDYLQGIVSSSVPVPRDPCQHPLVTAIDFVHELLLRGLRDNTHLWTDDWTAAKEVIERGILSTKFPRNVPSTTKIVGGILAQIMSALPSATAASAAAADVDMSDASAVGRASSAVLTRSLAAHKLNHSKTHPLAHQVFAAFPYLLR